MALSRVKTWNAAETLTASDLNAEFNNICNHFGSLDNDDINSTATFTMGELIVGSGITSADGGQLHVHTASAGTIQAVADADEAVFENSAASGITILSGTSSTGMIAFGDSGDADIGKISYSHSTNGYTITANAATALQISSAGAVTTGGSVLSDTDSTDSLGSASVRWANLYVDSIGDTGQALAITAGTNAINLTAGDVTLYDDNNNADTSISMGTSATEALVVQALNGGSNKTLEELRLTTKTASGTADHGKVTVYVDEAHIADVDDSGINLASGKTFRINGTNVVASAGDFSGPGSATDNAVVRFDGTGGKTAQNSGVTIDDSNNATGFANLTLSGELDAATGDFSGDVDVDGTMEADAITIGGTAIGSIYGVIAGSSSIVTTGALDSGSITSGFGTIDTGSSSITTTGAISSGALTATGNVSLNGGSFVFNEAGADKDFRIEGDTEANLFVSDASTDRIGIGTATPAVEFEIAQSSTGVVALRVQNTNTSTGADRPGKLQLGGKVDAENYNHGILEYQYVDTAIAQIIGVAKGSTSGTGRGGALRFFTKADNGNLAENMHLDASGRLGIGVVPAATRVLDVEKSHDSNFLMELSNTSSTNPNGLFVQLGAITGNNTSRFFQGSDSSGAKIYIYSDGDLANSDGTYGTISDAKLKQDITDIRSYWDDFKALQYRKYRHKIDVEADPDAPYRLGLIAQEVESVFPSLVPESPDPEITESVAVLDEDGNAVLDEEGKPTVEEVVTPSGTTHKWVKSSIIEGPIMASVVKELQTRLEAAETKIAALEAA